MSLVTRSLSLTVALTLSIAFYPALPANAAVVDSVPDQAGCTYPGGSATPLWGTGALTTVTPPVVASMTVNGEAVPFGQITNPADHKLGVAICPAMPDARLVGLNVIHREGSSMMSNLTGAQTPSGTTFTSSMSITLTLTNLGPLAEYYTYSLIHGNVSSYTTTNLGTTNAAITITVKPTRAPLLDYADAGANFCTATPPVCTAAQSRLDIMSVSMGMDFDQTRSGLSFSGAYFALDSATGGFVTPITNTDGSRSIKATLGGPHFLADGVTPNVGNMQAYLPTAVLASLLDVDAAALDTTDLEVERTDPGDPGDAPFTVSAAPGGAIVAVNNITFSTPVYTISSAAPLGGSLGGSNGSGGAGGGPHLFAADGGVFDRFGAGFFGSAAGLKLNKPIVGGSSTSSGEGYWMTAADGGVFAFGDARFYGSHGATALNSPVVGLSAAPSGNGYWLVAGDGGVFTYGSAPFRGSRGGARLNSPVVALRPTTSGNGYWLVAADGGVFSYGDAQFFGSRGGTRLNSPIVTLISTPTGHGYWLVAADGGVFSYGDAQFFGSLGGTKLNSPVTAALKTGNGYALVTRSGEVFGFGDAAEVRLTAIAGLAKPIVGIG